MQTTLSSEDMQRPFALEVQPDAFDPARHFYPRVLNAQLHPMLGYLMRMCRNRDRIVARYCHLNPQVDGDALRALLETQTHNLHWAGGDLLYTVTDSGVRRMIVLETNSCPSGNKSMPLLSDDNEQGGYRTLMERAFWPRVKKRSPSSGRLAVIYDKNFIEASGYAAALADVSQETVLLAAMPAGGGGAARFHNRMLRVTDEGGSEHDVRAAFRYVTQRPWDRIPVATKTAVFNPVLGCLAGGRNKLVAAKAYELFNAELKPHGLRIRLPETIRDITLDEVPLWVDRFGGHAVVKNPYSNAGQGVWTITNHAELEAFMNARHDYQQFIVQALVGNSSWSSVQEGSRFFHVGTMPTKRSEIYAFDLRMMVCSGPDGFAPISVYARRAAAPLRASLDEASSSWEMLGTNLSQKAEGGWRADTERLMLMDEKDFNKLGLGIDDLLEAYIQTVLSTIAIDRLAQKLRTSKGNLHMRLFKSMNGDPALLKEIIRPRDGDDGTDLM